LAKLPIASEIKKRAKITVLNEDGKVIIVIECDPKRRKKRPREKDENKSERVPRPNEADREESIEEYNEPAGEHKSGEREAKNAELPSEEKKSNSDVRERLRKHIKKGSSARYYRLR